MHSALDEVLHGKKSAKHIRETWEIEKAKFPKNSLHMRFSDNHDERRAIARFGEGGALAAQALAFTIDGVPMFYNGMEVGDTTESGFPALFEKMLIFWDIKVRRPEFPLFYDGMKKLRAGSNALRRGETVWVKNSDEDRVLTFKRTSGNEEILVAINMSNAPFFGSVEASGIYEEITPNIEKSFSNGLPSLSLKSFGFRFFRKK
jgi:glycosidase